jgi:hypothetical protein
MLVIETEATMSDHAQEIIGKIVMAQRRPERFALMFPNGDVSNFFPMGLTREQVVADLAAHGMIVRDDDTVVRA